MLKVSIIIVNWNGKDDTLECLSSLRADEYSNKNIIVVDNGSTDDSVAAIRAEFPEVDVVETGENLGFTGGNNAGIKYALEQNADFVYLLNNDTTVEPDALSNMMRVALERPDYGALTPLIFYHSCPNTPWFSGSTLSLRLGTAYHDNSRIPQANEGTKDIPWASGCALLLSRKALSQMIGFDERYYLNWEDVDLCVRLTKAGFSIGLVPQARIYHKVGRSQNKVLRIGPFAYYSLRNHLLFVRLHSSRSLRTQLRVAIRQLRQIVSYWRKGDPETKALFLATMRAWFDHARGRYGK